MKTLVEILLERLRSGEELSPEELNQLSNWGNPDSEVLPILEDLPDVVSSFLEEKSKDEGMEKCIENIKKRLSSETVTCHTGFKPDHLIFLFTDKVALENFIENISYYKYRSEEVKVNPDFKRFFRLGPRILIVFFDEGGLFVSSELNEFFTKIPKSQINPLADICLVVKETMMQSKNVFNTLRHYHQTDEYFIKLQRYYRFPGGEFLAYLENKIIETPQTIEIIAEKAVNFLQQANCYSPNFTTDHDIFWFTDKAILKKLHGLINNTKHRNAQELCAKDFEGIFKLGTKVLVVFHQKNKRFNSPRLEYFFKKEIIHNDFKLIVPNLEQELMSSAKKSLNTLKTHYKSINAGYLNCLLYYYEFPDGQFFKCFGKLNLDIIGEENQPEKKRRRTSAKIKKNTYPYFSSSEWNETLVNIVQVSEVDRKLTIEKMSEKEKLEGEITQETDTSISSIPGLK